jgi:hypothetical protein
MLYSSQALLYVIQVFEKQLLQDRAAFRLIRRQGGVLDSQIAYVNRLETTRGRTYGQGH